MEAIRPINPCRLCIEEETAVVVFHESSSVAEFRVLSYQGECRWIEQDLSAQLQDRYDMRRTTRVYLLLRSTAVHDECQEIFGEAPASICSAEILSRQTRQERRGKRKRCTGSSPSYAEMLELPANLYG